MAVNASQITSDLYVVVNLFGLSTEKDQISALLIQCNGIPVRKSHYWGKWENTLHTHRSPPTQRCSAIVWHHLYISAPTKRISLFPYWCSLQYSWPCPSGMQLKTWDLGPCSVKEWFQALTFEKDVLWIITAPVITRSTHPHTKAALDATRLNPHYDCYCSQYLPLKSGARSGNSSPYTHGNTFHAVDIKIKFWI